jgi:hypothetical protein
MSWQPGWRTDSSDTGGRLSRWGAPGPHQRLDHSRCRAPQSAAQSRIVWASEVQCDWALTPKRSLRDRLSAEPRPEAVGWVRIRDSPLQISGSPETLLSRPQKRRPYTCGIGMAGAFSLYGVWAGSSSSTIISASGKHSTLAIWSRCRWPSTTFRAESGESLHLRNRGRRHACRRFHKNRTALVLAPETQVYRAPAKKFSTCLAEKTLEQSFARSLHFPLSVRVVRPCHGSQATVRSLRDRTVAIRFSL